MASPELSATPSLDAAGEQEVSLKEFLQAFPLRRAPYTRPFLWVAGILGSFLGAGIVGAVNLRRTGQSRSIPRLLLLSVGLTVLLLLVSLPLNEWMRTSPTSLEPAIRFLLNYGIGFLFGEWLARRQQGSIKRWVSLTGASPRWRDQGGLRVFVGWVLVIFVVIMLVGLAVLFTIYPPILRAIYPAQYFSAQNVGITLPAGMVQVAPETIPVDCDVQGSTCFATVRDRLSGQRAAFLVSAGAPAGKTPQSVANDFANDLRDQDSSQPVGTPKVFTSPFLGNRDAYNLNVHTGDAWLTYTTVASGDDIVILLLYCNTRSETDCEDSRDLLLSGIEFAS